MRISPEVEIALSLAATEAARRRHEFLTVEHLLYALLFDEETSKAVRAVGGDIKDLKKQLERFLDDNLEALPTETTTPPQPTVGVQNAIRRAAAHVESSGKDLLTGTNLLVAMFAERDSFALSLLEGAGITRFDLIAYISHGIANEDADDSDEGELAARGDEGPGKSPGKKDALAAYTLNLNEEAKAKRIDPLIGRLDEIDRIIQILARRKKNNPLLVGDPGVGKTAIAEGFALKITLGEVPKTLREDVVYALDMGSLLAGTRYRGDFEERVKAVLRALAKIPHAILFIDEIHTLVGAGATSGGSMDASNLLKPALASGRLRCIGSTTFQEYRSHLEKDRALARRFQRIDLSEPSLEETIQILRGLQPQYEEFHGVTFTPEAVQAAGQLAAKYMHDKKLPDKAIDLLDEAGAAAKLARASDDDRPRVDIGAVEAVLCRDGARAAARGAVERPGPARLARGGPRRRRLRSGPTPSTRSRAPSSWRGRGCAAPRSPSGRSSSPGRRASARPRWPGSSPGRSGWSFIRFDMSEYMERHTRLAPHRRAARLRRLRPGRPADRRHRQDPARGPPARRDREGPPGRVQRALADHGPRQADRQRRQDDGLSPRHPAHDEQRRGARPGPPRGRLRRRAGDRATPSASISACSAPSSATGSTPASRSTRCPKPSWRAS